MESEIVQSIAKPEGVEQYNQPARFMHMNYLKMDVVEGSKARLRYIVQNYDRVIVSFSGGKDSLVLLSLLEEVWAEMGRKDKIEVKFMDEELVCDDIIDFVQEVADTGRFNFKWYCLPMYVGFFVLGKHKPFVTWDKSREWHRKPPERDYVVYDIGANTRDENENSISRHMYPDTKVTVAELVGIRADESMKRFMAVKGTKDGMRPNYISNDKLADRRHIFACKPIYDWTEMDIFKYLKNRGIKYCPHYNAQVWAKAPLRVASTMHERAQGSFFKLKEMAPRYYEQLRSIYPEIETHFRYGKEVKKSSVIDDYPHNWAGLRQYVEEHIDASHQEEAVNYINEYEARRKTRLKENPEDRLGSVSVLQVSQALTGGKFAKGASLLHRVTQQDIDYEAGH